MSASHFCNLIEQNLLPCLPRHQRRSDGKLTPSERKRLHSSFDRTWQLAHHISDPKFSAESEKQLAEMDLRELLRVRETAAFLFGYISQSDREEIAGLKGDDLYDDGLVTKGTERILEVFGKRNLAERGGSMPIPEGAPLDFFTFFDQWQGDVEQIASKQC